ncbi:2-oxo-4-hydroxy-4-carboxy-5-ureidoimidazoline decarboxylase [Mycobacterium sp. MMS18-G62]
MLGLDRLLDVCSSRMWAQQVLAGGPFRNADDLLAHADSVLAQLTEREIDAALAGHPRIGAPAGNPSSAREQAGVRGANEHLRSELADKNRAYEDKFGYVYLVCASGRSAGELLATLTDRLNNDPETERRVMRTELMKINRLRLQRLLSQEGAMAQISTHVLDAVTGLPAAGVPVALTGADGTVLAEASTDGDGRVSELYSGQLSGVHRLRFDTAAYFAVQGVTGFYPEIVVAFEISDSAGKYHVPVLLSPYAYSTYRGS